ncbi:MAG: twin-arginine translocase TatA/TatE family subunit [Chloroflexi bacterium]|jgi:sec-independent protein translocase protein TatA|nr:twin-arginine translocase TatA/TatE family subunit [Chloroflexota bacterium]
MLGLGAPELLIILVIVAMLFGVGKLPEVFGSIGKGIREFRKEAEVGTDNKVTTIKTEQPVDTVVVDKS